MHAATFCNRLFKHSFPLIACVCVCVPQVDLLSASPGKVVCEMRVEEEHTNRGGTLHGGLTATLVDVISTMAIMYSERGAPGVSVDMNIT